MKSQLLPTSIENVEADAVAIVLFESSDDTPPGQDHHALTNGLITELYESKEFTGKALDTALIHRPAGFKASRLLLVGGGKPAEFSPPKLRQAAGTALRFLKPKGGAPVGYRARWGLRTGGASPDARRGYGYLATSSPTLTKRKTKTMRSTLMSS